MAVALVASTLVFDHSIGDISNTPRMMCWAVLLAGVVCCAMAMPTRRRKGEIGLRGLNKGEILTFVSMLCFVVWQFLSVLWAVNRAEALCAAARWLLAAMTGCVTFELVGRCPVRGVVLLARCSAIVTLLALSAAVWQLFSIPDFSWSNRYAVVSLFTHKGTFAMLLVLLAVFPAMRLGLKIRRGRWFYVVLLLVLLLVECFLQSRAVLVALVAGVGCWILLAWLSKRAFVRRIAECGSRCKLVVAVAVALLIACIPVAGAAVISNGSVEVEQDAGGIRSSVSICERRALWQMTFRMVERKPIAGCGAGNWKVCHPEVSVRDVFSIDALDFRFVRPHNEYLAILSETGCVGLLLLSLALAGVAVAAVGGVCRGGRRRRLLLPGLAGLCGVAAFAFFDFPFERMELLLWISVFVGGVCALSAKGRAPISYKGKRYFGVVVIGLSLLVAVLAWGHWRSERCLGDIVNGIHTMKWRLVEKRAREAQTPFATLASDGVPFAYYEAMACEYQRKPALAVFRKAMHDSPYDKQVLNDVARVLYTERHEVDSAAVLLEQAIYISPDYSRSYFNLAQMYLFENRPEEAAKVLHSLDLDKKRSRMEKNIWFFLPVKDAEYYFKSLLPAEQNMRDRLLQIAGGSR